jgi:DNA-directed RNA polymerase subunit M/transcription elongation factor TFIIS
MYAQMISDGYRFGAPSHEAEDIDAQVVKRMRCPKCHGKMHYEGYHKPSRDHTEYVALAVCNACGHTISF